MPSPATALRPARVKDLLRLVPRQPAVRKITATDLRTHADCARRYQLLSLQGLPGEALTGEALLRAQFLDSWLRGNHMRGVGCAEADVDRFLAETADELETSMARRNLEICPLADPGTSSGTLAAQSDVATLDAGSRVLLVALKLVPGLHEAVESGRRDQRFAGTGDLPNLYRESAGPGWALAGDAGHHKDPSTGMGMSDAFLAADLLADAIHDGLTGRKPMDAALAGYQRRRDRLTDSN